MRMLVLLGAVLLAGCHAAPAAMPTSVFALEPTLERPATLAVTPPPPVVEPARTHRASLPATPAPVVVARSSGPKPVTPASEALEQPAPDVEALAEAPMEVVDPIELLEPDAPVVRGEVDVAPDAPRSGLWRFEWAIGDGEPHVAETQLTFHADGTVESADVLPEWGEAPGSWGEGAVDFTGTCGPMWPERRTGFSCDRYALAIQSDTVLVGTVSIQVNYRWIDVPVTGYWVDGSMPAQP